MVGTVVRADTGVCPYRIITYPLRFHGPGPEEIEEDEDHHVD